MKCPDCSATILPDAAYCDNCGKIFALLTCGVPEIERAAAELIAAIVAAYAAKED